MNLYFGTTVSTISTLLIISLITYIIYSTLKRDTVHYWGRKTALLASFGLIVCCFVATRDGYDKSVQASFDPTITSGVFSITSIQSTLCCIGGAIIAFASFSSIFVKNQKYRKVMFFTLCIAILIKILVIEISRWVVLV